MVYQPVCRGCRDCVPIRVPVETFRPNKSQRRCQRANGDLRIDVGPPALTDEKARLYGRYVASRHGAKDRDDEASELEAFLYRSPVDTLEFTYRSTDGALAAVGICDICPQSLSSVYFYFDPELARRGLGTFGSLVEIAYALSHRIPQYYLGYWVRGCRAMEYKRNFRPYELLGADGTWTIGIEPANADQP